MLYVAATHLRLFRNARISLLDLYYTILIPAAVSPHVLYNRLVWLLQLADVYASSLFALSLRGLSLVISPSPPNMDKKY